MTKIEWCRNPDGTPGETWNPLVGCTKISAGCKNCYAKALHDMRHKAYVEGKRVPKQYAVPFETVTLHPERLEMPLHWAKPRRVFVNSMSDLFHERVYDRDESFLNEVFAIMAATPQHTYMVLTKRPVIMRNYLTNPRRDQYVEHSLETIYGEHGWCSPDFTWPLPNVWLGVSVENQKAADERIPYLLKTPAAVRFVSCEPLLGPVQLSPQWMYNDHGWETLDWVIAGGESGPGARPMHPDWARLLRDQCQAADVPFFFKQWGEFIENGKSIEHSGNWITTNTVMQRVGKAAAGRLLDGQEWNQFPEAR